MVRDRHDVPSDHPGGPAPATVPPKTQRPAEPRYCVACSYELSGLAVSRCPECGLGFDPADPTTSATEPALARRRRRDRRAIVALLIVLGLVVSVRFTLIPVPNLRRGFKQWIWLNERYGVEDYWAGNGFIRVSRWADRPYLVRGEEHPSGRAMWELRLGEGDRWNFDLHDPGTSWKTVLAGFNLLKTDMFGVQFEAQDPPAPVLAFSVSGSKVDVISAFVKSFGLRVNSMMIHRDQPYVWMYDRASERLRAMELPESEQRWFRTSGDMAGRELVPPDRELLPYTRPEEVRQEMERASREQDQSAPDDAAATDQPGATP